MKVKNYVPTFDANLNLKDLGSFYDKFEPKSHPEKILIFSVFLRDYMEKSTCSANDIFTCYRTVKDQTKIPEAFIQALRDTHKAGYITYTSPEKTEVSIAGENHFNGKLKKKGNTE